MKEEIANPIYRLLSYLVDGLTYVLIWIVLLSFLASSNSIADVLNSLLTIIILGFVLVPFAWVLLNSFLISRFGGTIGKLMTGTAIINPRGKNVSFWRAFFRNYIGYMVSAGFLGLGFIWILVDRERRGWHDQIADTYVVVKNRSFLLVGILVLTALIVIDGLMAFQVFQGFGQHREIYTGVVSEAENSINNSSRNASPFATQSGVGRFR